MKKSKSIPFYKNPWIWGAGLAAAGGYWWWSTQMKPKSGTETFTGVKVLAKADNDNAFDTPALVDLLRFLNLDAVNAQKMNLTDPNAAVAVATDRTKIFEIEPFKTSVGVLGEDLTASNFDALSDAKKEALKRMVFNDVVENRLLDALGVTTINTESVKLLYNFASTPTGDPATLPNLAQIYDEFKKGLAEKRYSRGAIQ